MVSEANLAGTLRASLQAALAIEEVERHVDVRAIFRRSRCRRS